ncbi:hypothetical protein CDL12_03970 [Handroanthus impetiginosus]|uniref:Uncharacterized protein n=1 Tax=Handroanthus impetiginosus TaxID=429701 RepID=A0A2G9I0K9_9LAMI|nr:hypothetical protein CDL12_03970 [Handroanthus impetiginosus]
MAIGASYENKGDKENIPSSSSVKLVAVFPSKKKRKLRTPLKDITNLIYPGFVSSAQESPAAFDTPSLFLLACLVYQVENRYKRVDTKSNAAAATLRKHFR